MELVSLPQWEGALRILPRVPNHRVTKLAGCMQSRWLPGDGLHADGRAQLPGVQVAPRSWNREVREETTW